MEALVMSGGGSKGSWEAGVLRYLGQTREKGYGFVSGTSVGSINALGVTQFSEAKFAAAAIYVEDLWQTHISHLQDVLKLRFPPVLSGLWEPSIGKADPLEALLREAIDLEKIRASGVRLRMPAVDLLTGTVHEYTEQSGDPIKGCLASSAYPLAFPPVDSGNRYEVDGGVRDTAPLGAAIGAGADRVTLLLVRDPKRMKVVSRAEMSTCMKVGLRVLDIMMFEGLQNDIKVCGLYNDLVDAGAAPGKRKVEITVLFPSRPLADTFTFDKATMQAQIIQGYEDARAQLGG